jgi:hypothetical protein
MFQTKVVEKITRHIFVVVENSPPPPPESRAFFEIRWKSVVETDRPQITIWRMRIACYIPKARTKHSEYVILIAFPRTHWIHERASMVRYTYIAYLVLNLRIRVVGRNDTRVLYLVLFFHSFT